MTRDEIVTALRCCGGGEYDECNKCPMCDGINCCDLLDLAAADLIENQQRHIESLMKANDSLKDAIARRDKQIEDMKLGADRKALINELCQYCGKYKQAHEGACDGCRWKEK